MAFIVKKRVDLSTVGEGWKDAYLEFNSPTIRQIQEMRQVEESKQEEAGFELLKNIFIGGKGFDGTSLVEIKADDFLDLPAEVLNLAAQALVGPNVSPN